jgi:methyl-accepting chemotaxis protein
MALTMVVRLLPDQPLRNKAAFELLASRSTDLMNLFTIAGAAARRVFWPRQRSITDVDGQLAAINRSHLVVEFSVCGKILSVNDNFCRLMGYAPRAVIGQHHHMLVGSDVANEAAQQGFWEKLARGQSSVGCYEQRAADGRAIWLQATYNPILDRAGRPFKVVQYACDVTAQTLATRALHDTVARLSDALTVSIAQSRDASEIAVDASESVVRGGAVLEEIVDTVRDISRQNDVISEIVAVIDDLAFQTDLLALNAAMEVAWSGDAHSGGFAVVAGEARKVARQSAQSASTLRQRLGQGVERAESGADLSGRASLAMQDIVTSISRVNDRMADIHDASVAQSSGVNALQDAISRFDDGAQKAPEVDRAA